MDTIKIRKLGTRDYSETWQAMREFTEQRKPETTSEIWLLQHPPVFTQGQAGKPEHLLHPGKIPVIQSDRGGQVTYHGPGQLIVYLLLNLKQLGLGVRGLVNVMEASVVELLAAHGIAANTRRSAPGVYVGDSKIASLGLRVRKGYCYHGLALNVDMNLEPFSRINPCGFTGLSVTQLSDLGVKDDIDQVGEQLLALLRKRLAY